ncbi:MAG: hypothetical protein GX946_06575 [Oligosphaeraceae bacterium]|nr:hypothetical protein [Oligosphaeraceae bacterium]
MPKFVRTICTALAWNRQHCYVLRLQRSRDKFKLLSCWDAEVGKDQSLAELLPVGLRHVGSSEQEFIVAAASGGGWGSVDLRLPALAPAELKNALRFELRKQTPIAPEKLRWGYRVLARQGKDNNLPVRLFYVKDDEWGRWYSVLNGMPHVDVILPAPLCLDPLFYADDFCFLDGNSCFVFRREGERRLVEHRERPAELDLATAFPPLDAFQLGELAEKPTEVQLAYMPALLAAVYGLSENSNLDQKTLIAPPENLRARRYFASKLLAGVLLLFICLILGLGLLRQVQSRAAHLRMIDAEIGVVQAQLKALRDELGSPQEKEFAANLEQELRDNIVTAPSFPEVLLELSNLIEAPTWASSRLEWNAGQVTMQLQSPQRDLELPGKLEESPILGDVRELSSSYNQGSHIARLTLNARYDTPEEKLEFEQRRARRREAERLAREKQEQQAAMEDEQHDDERAAVNDDEGEIEDEDQDEELDE